MTTISPEGEVATDAKVEEVNSCLVGDRVRVAGHLATVRWGPGQLQVPPSQRRTATAAADETTSAAALETIEVVGIEYDEEGIGKHDGSYQGARLFECENGKGSFVKLDKIEFGISIQRALAERYFASLLPDAASKGTQFTESVDSLGFTDSKGRAKEKNVELVGRYALEQRQARLESFLEMSLGGSNIRARYPEELWTGDWSLPNLKALWLDKTLVSDWSDVAAFCELCPKLEWLSFVKCRFQPIVPASEGSPLLPPPRGLPAPVGPGRLALEPFHCQVKTIILNSTMITWPQLFALAAAGVFPSLEVLHLARNKLVDGVPAVEGAELERQLFPRLKSLVLDENEISDWRVIRNTIATFPSLEQLHLNGNHLGANLEGLAELAADQTPRRLVGLFLNENRLASWHAVGFVASYALLELKVQRNPLSEGTTAIASSQMLRQLLIALMPTVTRLNASEVTTKERNASERYFLSMYRQESPVIKALGEVCNVAEHADRLVAIHGDVVASDNSEVAGATRGALVNALVEVTLRPIGAAILDKPQVKKKLPHTMTVAELKRLCQALFKQVPLERLSLILADPGMPFGLPFEDENRELGFYGVSNDSEIRVDDLQDAKGDRDLKRVQNLIAKMEDSEI